MYYQVFDMKNLEVKADYVNLQFHIFQDNRWVDIKLPAEVMKAIVDQVEDDVFQYFTQKSQLKMPYIPTGLAKMIESKS